MIEQHTLRVDAAAIHDQMLVAGLRAGDEQSRVSCYPDQQEDGQAQQKEGDYCIKKPFYKIPLHLSAP